MADENPFARHKARKDRAWQGRSAFDKLYADAYEFAMPQRRPGRQGRPLTKIDRLYDMSAIVSTFHFAGQLQLDLFPPGQSHFELSAGPIAKLKLSTDNVAVLDKGLANTSSLVHPFFATGEWDQAIHEVCLDLAIGTGGLYPAKGTRDNPVRFVSIPSEDLAVETDAYGDTVGTFWRQHLARQAIKDALPEGTYPQAFVNKLNSDETIPFYQDFVRGPDGLWHFCAYVEDSVDGPIARNRFRTKPIATPRYYRVPGEAYGRGPVLLALPSIKTLNMAQELALKSAAIQMLGIWGYRAGGSFNPDTVRVGPGEFWPMMATGGVLGADVQRLDPASGRLDVARMVIGSLQEQIRATLLDQRLPDPGGTPASASEIIGRLRQKKAAHMGAFGRLTREIMPVVVPRVMEILHSFGYLPQRLPIDELLIAMEVTSPMAQALKADRLSPIISHFEIIAAMAGPQNVPLYAKIDETLDLIATETRFPPHLKPTPTEREKIRADMQAKEAAQAALELAAQAGAAAPAQQKLAA